MANCKFCVENELNIIGNNGSFVTFFSLFKIKGEKYHSNNIIFRIRVKKGIL
jgi:hypothetical protein